MEHDEVSTVLDVISDWPLELQLDTLLRALYKISFKTDTPSEVEANGNLLEARYHLRRVQEELERTA